MERKEFLSKCGMACLGALGISALVPGCTPSQQLNATIRDNKMQVPLSVFINKGKETYKRYVIVRNENLNYPIVVYRNAPDDYTALLLRCSHQYNELNVNGELLTCPAHGSEFNAKGEVTNGPADMKLRSFPVSSDATNLYIQLA